MKQVNNEKNDKQTWQREKTHIRKTTHITTNSNRYNSLRWKKTSGREDRKRGRRKGSSEKKRNKIDIERKKETE